MRSTYTSFMHSKYFSPVFNSAIFDGPVRIYFSQIHESLALKIYFLIQQNLKEEINRVKEITKITKQNLLIMLYPTEEIFLQSFISATDGRNIISEPWCEDLVLGLRSPLEELDLDLLIQEIKIQLHSWPLLDIQFGLEPAAALL